MTDVEAAGAINIYTCNICAGHVVTVNRDQGATAFVIRCRATEGCLGEMISHFYKVDQGLKATWQWYSPRSAGERKKVTGGWLADHVAMGGLMLRSLAH